MTTQTPSSRRPLDAFAAFFRAESAGGIVLLACAVFALIWANSPAAASYFALWQTPLKVGPGAFSIDKPLLLWINDGLMAVFFFLIGLEIKRELLGGELASPKRAALALAAAIGGMLVPAALYVSVTAGTDAVSGWGIPMATDIAFALGVLALLGSRVPLALKVFLTALAIVDDLGAVLVIALFYTAEVSGPALALAAAGLGALALYGRSGGDRWWVYVLVGLVVWVAVLKSGVHATVAGVLVALTVPATARDGGKGLLHTLEHALHKPVAFGVMPVFALANAGVAVGAGLGAMLVSPVAVGIGLGLVLGKPVGVLLLAWGAVRVGLARLPEGVTWTQVAGVALLCGIGFTMAIFIAGLAFPVDPALLDAAKVGILGGSLVAGVLGGLLLARSTRPVAAV